MPYAAEHKMLLLLRDQGAHLRPSLDDPTQRVLDLLHGKTRLACALKEGRASTATSPPSAAPVVEADSKDAPGAASAARNEPPLELTLLLDRGAIEVLLSLIEHPKLGNVYRFLAVGAGLLLADRPGPKGLIVRMYAQSVLEAILTLETRARQGTPLGQVPALAPDQHKEVMRSLFVRRPRLLHCGPHEQPQSGLLLSSRLGETGQGRLYRRLFGQHTGLLHHLRIVWLLAPTTVLDISPWPSGPERSERMGQIKDVLGRLHSTLGIFLDVLERPTARSEARSTLDLAQSLDETLVGLHQVFQGLLDTASQA